jgi:nicotine blue oxidoreductase
MIAALILAGGASKRMGGPKALLPFPDQPLVAAQWLALRFSSLDPLRVVVGVGSRRVIDGSGLARENFVVNKRPAGGPFSSLQVGLKALLRDDTWPAVVVQPVDAFPPNPGTVVSLAKALAERRSLAALPSYGGRGGHPVMLSRPLCKQLLTLKGKAARLDEVLHRLERAGLCERVEVPAGEILVNLNDAQAYRGALAALGIEPGAARRSPD